jgi:phosphatidyl-myo-inositol dimannoside synthase
MTTERRTSVIALLPSKGLSGGIESYAQSVTEALDHGGANVIGLHLVATTGRPGIRTKASFVLRTLSSVRGAKRNGPVVIVAFHRGFGLLASFAARVAGGGTRAYVIYHGDEAWTARSTWGFVIAPYAVQLVAVSAFTAGSLVRIKNAHVLPPGIRADRFERLRSIGRDEARGRSPLRILSVFVLERFAEKGGPDLLEACELLQARGTDLVLTIAGRGPAPDRLTEAARRYDWMRVVGSPTDDELDSLYRDADVFVLATRTRLVRGNQSGEGFGIVLVEAALAGLPVVAPAFGGSTDAYLPGITGLRPTDESSSALAATLQWVARYPAERARMGSLGREWATVRFSPETYRAAVRALFLGDLASVTSPMATLDEAEK